MSPESQPAPTPREPSRSRPTDHPTAAPPSAHDATAQLRQVETDQGELRRSREVSRGRWALVGLSVGAIPAAQALPTAWGFAAWVLEGALLVVVCFAGIGLSNRLGVDRRASWRAVVGMVVLTLALLGAAALGATGLVAATGWSWWWVAAGVLVGAAVALLGPWVLRRDARRERIDT